MRNWAILASSSNMADKTATKVAPKQKISPQKADKKRKTKWNDGDVKDLIYLMQEETIIFSMNNAKTSKEKSACYKIVHAEMNKKGIQCTLEDVINKWKKLKQLYKTYLDKIRRSGTEKRKEWKFFKEMDHACGNRDASTPLCLIDSSLTNISDSGSDCGTGDEPTSGNISDGNGSTELDIDDNDLVLSGTIDKKTVGEEVEEKNKNNEKEQKEKMKEVSLSLFKRKAPKKTKLEKSIKVLTNGFRAAAEKETEMMIRLEQIRHKEMLEHEIRLKELENERRREERQHELLLLKVLGQNRNQVPSQDINNFGPQHMLYGNMSQIHPPTNVFSQDETFSTYYKL